MALHISVARMLRCCSALLQGKADSSTNDNSFYYRILHVTEAARNRPVSPRIQMGRDRACRRQVQLRNDSPLGGPVPRNVLLPDLRTVVQCIWTAPYRSRVLGRLGW